MTYTVKCECCNMYVSLDICRAYSLRFPPGTGKPLLEAVDLGGREPWSGIRLVCNPCLAFLRTFDRPDALRRLLEDYVDSLDRAAELVAAGGASSADNGTMALQAVADDLRAILKAPETRGGPLELGEAPFVEKPPGEAPRGV